MVLETLRTKNDDISKNPEGSHLSIENDDSESENYESTLSSNEDDSKNFDENFSNISNEWVFLEVLLGFTVVCLIILI